MCAWQTRRPPWTAVPGASRRQELQPDNRSSGHSLGTESRRHLGGMTVGSWKASSRRRRRMGKAPYPVIVYPHGRATTVGRRWGSTSRCRRSRRTGTPCFSRTFAGRPATVRSSSRPTAATSAAATCATILTGIDELVKQKLIDRDRQFVYGTSYGGFLDVLARRPHGTSFGPRWRLTR